MILVFNRNSDWNLKTDWIAETDPGILLVIILATFVNHQETEKIETIVGN